MKTLFELPRYPFEERVIQGAPEQTGVYVLWEGTEVTFVGSPEPVTIKQRLLDLWSGRDRCPCQPTHYSWRLARVPVLLKRELLSEHQLELAALPRCNRA